MLQGKLDRCLKCLCLEWIHTTTSPGWVCITCDSEGQLSPIYQPPESIPITATTECLTSMEAIVEVRLKENGKSNLSALAPTWKPELKSVAVTQP